MSDRGPGQRCERLLEHAGWIRRLARSLAVDPHLAEDAAQEAWVAALERPGGPRPGERAWLAGVFRNVVRQTRRGALRRRRREQAAARPEPMPSTAALVERAELQEKVLQAVLALDEPYRSTILMRFFEELSAEEIAARLDVPSSTVRNRLKRGLERLRRRFDRELGAREAWTAALLAIALPPTRGSLPGGPTAVATTTGALAMSIQTTLLTSALVLAGWASTHAFRPAASAAPQAVAARAGAPLEAPQEAEDPTPPVPTPGRTDGGGGVSQPPARAEDGRRVVVPEAEADAEPAGVRFVVRVVDESGALVEGAQVFVGGRPSPFAEAPVEAMHVLDGPTARKLAAERAVRTDAVRTPRRSPTPDELERAEKELAALAAEKRAIQETHEALSARFGAARSLSDWAECTPEELERAGMVLGRRLETGADGSVRTELRRSDEDVYVAALPAMELRLLEPGSWHAVGRDGGEVRLVVHRVPFGELDVRVLDASTGRRFEGATAWEFSIERIVEPGDPGASGIVEARRLPTLLRNARFVSRQPLDEGPSRFTVRIERPTWGRVEETVTLAPGETRPVELRVDPGPGLSGTVVDRDGRPLADAVVYEGDPLEMRPGSLLGRVFHPSGTPGAVRTDDAGAFRLHGDPRRVTAWHPSASRASLDAVPGMTIRLGPRGAVEGSVPAGFEERAGVPIFLDGERATESDATGAFRLSDVEAGAHEVRLGKGLALGARVLSGATTRLDDPRPLRTVRLRLVQGGRPWSGTTHGRVLGLEPVFTQRAFFASADAGRPVVLELPFALPGPYLLSTREGLTSAFRIDGPEAVVELGTAELVVVTAPGREVVLLPEALRDDPFATDVARLHARAVPDSGELRFAPLPAGLYAVGTAGEGWATTVRVPCPGTRLVLP